MTYPLFINLHICAILSGAHIAHGHSRANAMYPCDSAMKEKTMETIFHVLGIVYYTVALFYLVSDRIQKNKE